MPVVIRRIGNYRSFLLSCTAMFLSACLLILLVFYFVDLPWVASALMVFAALGTTMLDGAGNVLFYRAVRGRERAEMTAVFATYRDVGQLERLAFMRFY